MATLSGNKKIQDTESMMWTFPASLPRGYRSGCSWGIKCPSLTWSFSLLNVKGACVAVDNSHQSASCLSCAGIRCWHTISPLRSWCRRPRGSVWSGTRAIRQRCPCTRESSRCWPRLGSVWTPLRTWTGTAGRHCTRSPGDRRAAEWRSGARPSNIHLQRKIPMHINK